MSSDSIRGFSWECADFQRFMSRFQRVQAEVRASCDVRKATVLAHMAADRIDRAFIRNASGLSGIEIIRPLSEALQAMTERQKQIAATSLRDSKVDFEVSTALWYISGRKIVVGRVFSEDGGAAYDRILREPGAADFSYWSGDRAEGVEPNTWRDRKAVWQRIIRGGFGTPLVATVDATWAPKMADIAPHLPTHAERVARRAKPHAQAIWVKQTQRQEAAGEFDFDLYTYHQHLFNEAIDGADAVACKILEGETERLSSLLPIDLTPHLLSLELGKAVA